MTTEVIAIKTYCLGYTHDKCDSCQHDQNWKMLNQMPDALRKTMQQKAMRIEDVKCRLTKMGEYQPIAEES